MLACKKNKYYVPNFSYGSEAMMKLSRRRFLSLAGAGAGLAAAPGLAALPFPASVEYGDARGESLWMNEAPIPPAPRLEDTIEADVAVIGSGYTGLSCAYYLRKLRPDLSVILLESHKLGSGASSRNSGAVSRSYRGLGMTALTQRGFDRLIQFITEEEIDCDLKQVATLELFPSKRDAQKLAATLPGAKWVPAGELRTSLQSSYYAGALESGDYITIHPGKLVAGHAEAARRVGVKLYEESPVVRIQDGKPARLSTPLGKVIARSVFIATNAYTARLGILRSILLPVHQFTFATGPLTSGQITEKALDRWPLRFERNILPVTTVLTPSGHFFIRIVLGYSSFNSCRWTDINGAKELARRMFEQRYPWISRIQLTEGWHGVTGHTLDGREIARPIFGGNILVSAAYNGLGVMPGHNNGYLAACRLAGYNDEDAHYFSDRIRHYPVPGEFYRSLLFKPFMKVMTPD
ncbi:MAG: FAD-binding oxidoreductase [Candidatus Abyssobacteria bacterium SURF_5]|uniref:FAD-binding oxidoreductase n=1 Tax=Abyssobacteria bacterium (strain SURF_5) TaxID=2093360 RepID=A0A3A4NFW4_ABYX5|nr:MAG: FAD-binding oxidoreductase [Candidatus Abyssubacteria bacterium SURF_5]